MLVNIKIDVINNFYNIYYFGNPKHTKRLEQKDNTQSFLSLLLHISFSSFLFSLFIFNMFQNLIKFRNSWRS